MSKYVLTRRADRDIDEIWQWIAQENGNEVADRIEQEFHRAMELLADNPGAGHTRPDVKRAGYRFWSVYSFIIAYRPATKPLTIARVVHGARNFKRLFR